MSHIEQSAAVILIMMVIAFVGDGIEKRLIQIRDALGRIMDKMDGR